MTNFSFAMDNETSEFFKQVATEMAKRFGISIDEAVGRVNQYWHGQIIDTNSLIFHKPPVHLAQMVYYEDGTYWWIEEWMAEHTPKPRPYP